MHQVATFYPQAEITVVHMQSQPLAIRRGGFGKFYMRFHRSA
jgi:hypothetical protein